MSARILDKEYKKYAQMCAVYGDLLMSYVEFRKEYLVRNVIPVERRAAFTRQIKHYKAVWQVPPDKMVTQACWAAAKREVPCQTQKS